MTNDEIESEAKRIVQNMCRSAHYNGTTTPRVVDEICDRYSNPIFCYGYARKMVFVPITPNTIAFKTVAM